jgi:hypothetical protein
VNVSDHRLTTLTKAYRFAIDPTPEQSNLLLSHIGGSRFAYNALLGLVASNREENRAKKKTGLGVTKDDYLSTSHFGLLYLWAENRDELAPWWAQNNSSTYNDAPTALERLYQLPPRASSVPRIEEARTRIRYVL